MTNEEICKRLNVDPKVGLSSSEAARRLQEEGPNKLKEAKPPNPFILFLKTLIDPLSIIMLLAGFLSIILPLALGRNIEPTEIPGIVVIFSIVLANSIIATTQEVKAQQSLKALQSMTEQHVVVLRDGAQKEVNVENLVRGDIIYLDTGRFVPADIRILEAPQLKVDESALTGESVPVEKTSDVIKVKDPVLGDQINIGFMSTYVTSGRATGIVVATGPFSEVGKIAKSISETKTPKTPLQTKLNHLTAWISAIALVSGVAIFLIQYFGSDQTLDRQNIMISSLIFSISAALALIPESLMIVVTVSLSVAAKKLARRHVIVKNFSAIETLGAVDVICSDKTGTLTQNKMTVEKLYFNERVYDVNEFKYRPNDKQDWDLVNGFILCSDAVSEGGSKIGDPTEIALTDWGHHFQINEIKLRAQNPRVDEIPFDSERKLMTVIVRIKQRRVVFTKGALDQLLGRCTSQMVNGKLKTLTPKDRQRIFKDVVPVLEDGLRILGLATKELGVSEKAKGKDLEERLIFIGAVALMDPPRREARLAVSRAHESGIRVIMITGDHKITALSIGRRLGIVDSQYHNALDGSEIRNISNNQLKEKLKSVNVFARVNPEDKSKIVEVLQSEKDIVAMTGDGVNDAPSLAKANVGIAMGVTGTDVAKEAANTILTDDNFASIISGVREGRNVYEKIKIAIAFLMGANFAQMFVIFFILLFGLIVKARGEVVALGNINVLWHILTVETILAIPISLGHSREQVMSYTPRAKNESVFKFVILEIISIAFWNFLFAVIAFLITYYTYAAHLGLVPKGGKANWSLNERFELSSLAAYVVVIFAPIFYAPITHIRNYTVFVPKIRREKIRINEWLFGAMALAFVLDLVPLFIPKVREFFNVPKTTNVSLGVDAIIILYSIGLSLLVLLFKWADGYIYELVYYRLHRDTVRISKFDFAKKQRQDRLKKLREEARDRLKDQFHHHN